MMNLYETEFIQPPIEHRRPSAIVKAYDMAYLVFERRDPKKMGAFLQDFGLVVCDETPTATYYRTYGAAPYSVIILHADRDRLRGYGFLARQESDLQRFAEVTGGSIAPVQGPGGGRYVRLIDPDGFEVDLVSGREEVAPLPTRDALPERNTPKVKSRVNVLVRTPLEPTPVFRLGHIVMQLPDFDRSADWYMRHFGLIPSDTMVLEDGRPALTFLRFDRGTEPADHHCLAIFGGPAPGLVHCAWETLDIDAMGQGHQLLLARGWKHNWGIGRHSIGSQMFDYWFDPFGAEWEHYADGDVMDANFQTTYHRFNRGHLWAWGEDVPPMLRPTMSAQDVPKLHAEGAFGKIELSRAQALIEGLRLKPRPWID